MAQTYISPTTDPTSSPSIDQPKIANNDDSLRSNFSGISSPIEFVAGQTYFNSADDIMYCRNKDNTEWVVVSNNGGGANQLISGTLSQLNHGTTIKIGSSETIMIPSESSVNLNYIVDMIVEDDTTITISSQTGQSFYRDNTLMSSTTITNSPNMIIQVCRFSDGKFIVGGVEKGIDSNFDNLSDIAKKVILDLTHSIGSSIGGRGAGFVPPMEGILGVHWEIEPEGYAPISSTLANSGFISGSNRLDIGATDGFIMTEATSHGHTHFVARDEQRSNLPATSPTTPTTSMIHDYNGGDTFRYFLTRSVLNGATADIGLTNEVGGNQPHYHNLNVKTITRATYWRVS